MTIELDERNITELVNAVTSSIVVNEKKLSDYISSEEGRTLDKKVEEFLKPFSIDIKEVEIYVV